MIREEMSGYAEPPRPPRKAASSWIPIVLVVLVGLGIAHIAGLTKPVTTVALQLSGHGRTPGWCLIGDWESDNDPMFRRVCHMLPGEAPCGTNIYLADAGRGMKAVIYKIMSEDRSGRQLEMAEYLPETDANYRVQYSIAEDGKSMTREYDGRNGNHYSCQYRYVGPPTEYVPRKAGPK
jgi:hypothetical protein